MQITEIRLRPISDIQVNRNQSFTYAMDVYIQKGSENIEILKRLTKEDNCAYTWDFSGEEIILSCTPTESGDCAVVSMFQEMESKTRKLSELSLKLEKGQALLDDIAKIIQ